MNLIIYLILELLVITCFIISFKFREEILWASSGMISIIMMYVSHFIVINNNFMVPLLFYFNGAIFMLSLIYLIIDLIDKYSYKEHNKIGDK